MKLRNHLFSGHTAVVLAVLVLPLLASPFLRPLTAVYSVAILIALFTAFVLSRQRKDRSSAGPPQGKPEASHRQLQAQEMVTRLMESEQEARAETQAVWRHFAFLDEAGDLLASSLDYEATLASVARLAVPRLADWCTIHIREEGEEPRQLAVAHIDPAKVEMARELGRKYPSRMDPTRGIGKVLATGEASLTAEITDEMLRAGAQDETHLALLRQLGLRSGMLVPLVARGRTLGVISFITAESGYSYGQHDLAIAEELARRAALAVDNARLYREAQESVRRREEVIQQLSLLVEASGKLTHQLDLSSVLKATLDLSHRLIAADAHGIWRRSVGGQWRIVSSSGLSDEYLTQQGQIEASPQSVPTTPVLAEDVQELPLLAERKEAYRREGIASLLATPLWIHGEVSGTLVFYYRQQHCFDDVTQRLAVALGNLAATAIGTAELYQRAQQELEQRVQTEQALRESEQSLRLLAEVMPQLVWSGQPDGTNDYYNTRWTEYTGLAAESLCGDGWKSALHPADRAGVTAAWQQAREKGLPYQVEQRLRGRDGHYRWFLARALPLHDEEGRLVKWYGTCTDIDEQKKITEKLREADRLKDEFLAMLAHELRNPLAPIRSSLQILAQPDAQPETVSGVREMMERQVRHMTHLLDDLLDVSRITRGKIELEREEVDVAVLVQRTVDSVRPLLEARRHELTVTLPAEPLFVEGDVTRLEQVLVNLLNNSCKYTDPAGHIWLEAAHDQGQAVLQVRDNGLGINEDMLPQIFDLFVQANRRLDRSQGGIGIGLTLVRKLVELHGGTIEAASPGLGQGSTFTVRLPALAARRQPAPDRPPVEQDRAARLGGGRRVLVVDDNVDAAESMGILLRMHGYQVGVVHDGPSALEEARVNPPEVVLLDIGMPGMGGHEVCRRLRERPEMQSAVVVAITGWGQEEDQRQSRQAGFDLHLTKPVDWADLNQVLRSLPARNGH